MYFEKKIKLKIALDTVYSHVYLNCTRWFANIEKIAQGNWEYCVLEVACSYIFFFGQIDSIKSFPGLGYLSLKRQFNKAE